MNKLSRGFTLIEVIIALLIFVIIALLMGVGLRQIIQAKTVIADKTTQLTNLQFTMIFLKTDIQHSINQQATNSSGEKIPPLVINIKPNEYLSFSRNGDINPLATENRSDLMRVAYFVKNGDLIRRTYDSLTLNNQYSDRILMSNIEDFNVMALDKDNKQLSHWPIYNTKKQTLPRGLVIHFCQHHHGCVDATYVVSEASDDKT